MYKFENLNQTLIGMCKELVLSGTWRDVRGLSCCEIPNPVLIEISNPTDRYITIPERKWNKYLPFAESLWIALGINDLDVLPAKYCKGLHKYSDNGKNWRAGYGPRIRAYSGMANDVCISDPRQRAVYSGYVAVVDQLAYVIQAFDRDPQTRQAILEIGDPVKDSFEIGGDLKVTKDYPCSRTLQFMLVDDKLNLTVYIRSNDVLYGMSAVNIFNFTWMQEYVANILGVPIGKYYHFANNLHMYDYQVQQVQELAALDIEDYASEFGVFQYKDRIRSLERFDELCMQLFTYEQLVYNTESDESIRFGCDMFDDWANVFLRHRQLSNPTAFINPYLNLLFK